MLYTESEKNFWKAHSMGCGYSGEFQEKKPRYPEDPVIFVCPECGSEYRPEQVLNGELLSFEGDSVDMFRRATDRELIEELDKRGYRVEKKLAEFWKE
jgi:NAD-dependent SIR2 family protein deacetylase